ncbi:MAG: histidine phosphatase family protein [Lachnospiraceae bacterium]|nr:histidine phosphatase family protein [Lachnospiraceae bacterium]
MKLYLIRHGETDQNKIKCLQGRTDIELNAYGRELAYKTAEGLREVDFHMIFTSPLKRARETAEIIKGERNIPMIVEERIQEISFGAYEGLCYGKEHYSIPDKDFMNFFDKPECYVTPPGGESFAEVLARTGAFLQELMGKKELADKTILLSTHGCALKALLAAARNTELANFWGEGVHKNCAVSLLEISEGQIKVLEDGRLYY